MPLMFWMGRGTILNCADINHGPMTHQNDSNRQNSGPHSSSTNMAGRIHPACAAIDGQDSNGVITTREWCKRMETTT